MESDEGNLVGRLRLFSMAASSPRLDWGFTMMAHQHITKQLRGLPLPVLERLALDEPDRGLRGSAGFIYACKLASDATLGRQVKAEKLDALVSNAGTRPDVAGYVKRFLSGYLGWPVGRWEILVDGNRPEAERIGASQDIILYCREKGYRGVLHRIAGDSGMPMKAREMATCAMVELRIGWMEPSEKGKVDVQAVARQMLEGGVRAGRAGGHRDCMQRIRKEGRGEGQG
jgi:hypothetical protein